MKALVKQGAEVAVRSWPAPARLGPKQVKLRVALAGFCRTDLYAAQGLLATADPLVLGHEFSGTISQVGAEVAGLAEGRKVAIFPWRSCGECLFCRQDQENYCLARRMLGVDLAGAFAEETVVDESMVHPLPPGVSLAAGAYLEPLAAALAVTRAGLLPQQHGLIWGTHRIGQLTYRLLRMNGFNNLELLPLQEIPPDNTYDFIVENFASTATFQRCLRSLKPGGKLVLKSRQPQPVSFQPLLAVTKEIVIQSVHYGGVEQALAILTEQKLPLDDLIGDFHPLEDWRRLFSESLEQESTKRFFLLSDEDVRAA
jgi:L-iditol 2-dehydrogenase